MADQAVMQGFEQARVPSIESNAAKFDDRQESESGETLLVYKRGDYNIVISSKEKLKVKIKAASKGEEPEQEPE